MRERDDGRAVAGCDDQGNPKTKNVLAKTRKKCAEKLKQLKVARAGMPSSH